LSRTLGANGMALAYVGGAGAVYGLGFFVLGAEGRSFQGTMVSLAARVTCASVAAGFVLYSVSDQASQLLGKVQPLPSAVVLISSLAVAGVSGAFLLLGLLVVLRVEEATSLIKYLTQLRAG
jgi:peptidoglycan biosynthesis protein MviN/MurJ (putative lipid II flippase)